MTATMDSSKTRILVVDDEPRAVELLVRTLRGLGKVTTAVSGEDAAALVAREPFDLVVSDQRMPGMSGVDLLGRVADRDDTCGRILLTGYSDLEATVEAINRGRVHAYLHKPCSPDDLKIVVQGVLERVHLAKDNQRLLRVVTDQNQELERALSELEDAQDRAISSERLAAVGQMLAMVAHDLRNPIAVIRSAGSEAQRLAEQHALPQLEELAADMLEESGRMQHMCADLLSVADASAKGERSPTPLDDVVADALRVVAEPASHAGVAVTLALGAGLELPLDKERLRRAVVNLLQNALDVLPDGGAVEVGTSADAEHATVWVADSGPGVPEEIATRLFEPFVTHGKPSGTGLGLAIVQKVAEDHGGSVRAEKGEAGGSRFVISLPIADAG